MYITNTKAKNLECSYLSMQHALLILYNNDIKSRNFKEELPRKKVFFNHLSIPPDVKFLSHFYAKESYTDTDIHSHTDMFAY